MNIKQAKEQIKNAMTAYFTRDDTGEYAMPAHQQRPVFLMGPPGIGKTAVMEQIAGEMGVALLSYSMTHHTRQSALGLPFIVHKRYQGGAMECDVSEYTMSEIIASIYDLMEESGVHEGILFLDEINCVSETLAPVMLQFLQYKTFGRHRVPDGWIVVTAGNPPEYNNSVREFDVVTWDRLKRIDVEPDYQVWKEYALSAGIHPAVTTYLDTKSVHFYSVKTDINGKSFVTARGWEDLSRMMRLYEQNKIPVDKLLISQYLQDAKIAAEFAQYYDLFRKYRSDYQIPSILDGSASDEIISRAKKAKFDERLALIGLMLDAMREQTQRIMDENTALSKLMDTVKTFRVRQVKEKAPSKDGWNALIEEKRKALDAGKKSASMAEGEQRILRRLLRHMTEEAALLTELPEADAFPALKKDFDQRVKELKAEAGKVGKHMTNMFVFSENAFGEGEELLIITTELTASKEAAMFIGTFGCKEYYRHNKELLLYERQGKIVQALKDLGL